MNKKSYFFIVLLVLLVMMAFVACNSKTETSSNNTVVEQTKPDALARILKAGKIVIASDFTATPMQYRDAEGNPTGLTVELINLAAEKLGVEVEWQDLAWESLIPSLNSGKCDMVAANMSMTLERAKTLRFTNPVMLTGISVLARADDEEIEYWSDLNNPDMKIGTVMGNVHAQYVRETWGMEPSEYETIADLVNEVKQGRIDGIMDDEMLLAKVVQDNPDLKLAKGFVRPDTYGWTFTQDSSNDNLINWFNWYLQWIKLTGEYNTIYEKYVGHSFEPNVIAD